MLRIILKTVNVARRESRQPDCLNNSCAAILMLRNSAGDRCVPQSKDEKLWTNEKPASCLECRSLLSLIRTCGVVPILMSWVKIEVIPIFFFFYIESPNVLSKGSGRAVHTI